MARRAALAAVVLAVACIWMAAMPAAARVCSTCEWGVCNATVSTTVCASCFTYYTGANCDQCASNTITVTRNGTDLGTVAGAFNGTVAGCIAACSALSTYTVYAGITNTSATPVCTCGVTYGNYGQSSSDADCAPCPSDSTLSRGGNGTVSVYFMPTGLYKGCYNDPGVDGSMTLCEENLATAAPTFNTDFTTASEILFGVFIGVCCIGAVYFIGLLFYCVHKRNAEKKKRYASYANARSGDYML